MLTNHLPKQDSLYLSDAHALAFNFERNQKRAGEAYDEIEASIVELEAAAQANEVEHNEAELAAAGDDLFWMAAPSRWKRLLSSKALNE